MITRKEKDNRFYGIDFNNSKYPLEVLLEDCIEQLYELNDEIYHKKRSLRTQLNVLYNRKKQNIRHDVYLEQDIYRTEMRLSKVIALGNLHRRELEEYRDELRRQIGERKRKRMEQQ